ncbi:signal peptidase I [Clostridium perfringens]|uniref:signal peptidase I n=1 Tax=Clostridium perfringens TaxID=1502 RepID=UPI00375457A7|nr:signal peptidase I [Clostridium perfringens]MDK0866015.1 signal peptidase I [Clostridium perfringens]
MSEKNLKQDTIKDELLFLILKIAIFIALLSITFLFIFGIYRCNNNMMSPAYKDGDLAIYYRLQKDYKPLDTVVVEKDGEKQIRRIIAKAGDAVDITDKGLKINGYFQQENEIYTETFPYKEGILFPVTIGEGEYFVLGDNRTNAKDSRIYGTVKEKEIKGLVMTLIRKRGL